MSSFQLTDRIQVWFSNLYISFDKIFLHYPDKNFYIRVVNAVR